MVLALAALLFLSVPHPRLAPSIGKLIERFGRLREEE
jgi:hypothetical protein